nr:hypothetical protein [Tanacetum cinerariifolium]
WLLWGDDDDVGGVCSGSSGESGGCDVVVAAEEWIRRVIASGVRDRVDRLMESVFGLGRKNPPENFPAAAAWWPAGNGLPTVVWWERSIM